MQFADMMSKVSRFVKRSFPQKGTTAMNIHGLTKSSMFKLNINDGSKVYPNLNFLLTDISVTWRRDDVVDGHFGHRPGFGRFVNRPYNDCAGAGVVESHFGTRAFLGLFPVLEGAPAGVMCCWPGGGSSWKRKNAVYGLHTQQILTLAWAGLLLAYAVGSLLAFCLGELNIVKSVLHCYFSMPTYMTSYACAGLQIVI